MATFIENCPYCGVYLSPDHQEGFNLDLLKAPYPLHEEETPTANSETIDEQDQEALDVEEEGNSFLQEKILSHSAPISSLFLTLGVFFSLFAIVLFFFEENGFLILKWNAKYWYVYGAIAVPSLILGSYLLLSMQDDQDR
ncbi:MAG: hypothetical protein ACSNEK_03390 [Parachlamydiaceae bacterium]